MDIKELRKNTGLSRAEFSREYNIPLRTLENWELHYREPPEWAVYILKRLIEAEDKLDRHGL